MEVHGDLPFALVETTAQIPLVGVVNGDCDLDRGAADEPFVLVAPMIPDPKPDRWRKLGPWASVRFFPFPDMGHGPMLLDVRFVQALERPVMPRLKNLGCPLTEVRRGILRDWLGARFSRYPYPTEIVEMVQKPIEDTLKTLPKRFTEAAVLLAATREFRLQATEGVQGCELLLVLDPNQGTKAGLNDQIGEAGIKQIQRECQAKMGRAGRGYVLFARALGVHDLSYGEVLAYTPISPSIES